MDNNLNNIYSTIFESSKVIFLLFEKETGKIVHANKSACEYYQYNYKEIISLNINDLNVLSNSEIDDRIKKVSSEKRNAFNFTHRLKNNELRRVEVISSMVMYENKEYLLSIVTDVNHKINQQLMIADLFYESPNAMVILDDEQKVLTINNSFVKLFGYELPEIKDKILKEFIVPKDCFKDLLISIDKVFMGEIVNEDSVRITKSKELINVNIIATPYIIGSEIFGVLLVFQDNTKQLELEKKFTQLQNEVNEKLQESHDDLQLILDSTSDAIYGIDTEGKCSFCNITGVKMLGFNSQDELYGKNIHELIHHSYRDGSPMSLDKCKIYQSMLNGIGVCADDEVFWRVDGTCFDVEYSSFPKIKNNQIIGAVITFRDITQRKKSEQQVEFLYNNDYLTGLFNRRYFEEAMKIMDSPFNLPISIIFGDANGLKLTNDIFGHKAGDELLINIANVLRKVCRIEDIIARVGGDEFAILLPKTNSEEALKIIKTINKEISKINIHAIKANISLGFETKMHIDDDLSKIMESAESWMYQDKVKNRKQVNTLLINEIIKTLHNRSPFEKSHSHNVSKLATKIAIELGLSEQEIRKIKDAAFLHDIGKIVLNDNILLKKTPLTKIEKQQMVQHPIVGYRILNLFDETIDIAEGVLNHHEYWDGSGYPKGISKVDIPLIARIIAVCEAYDSMINGIKKNSVEETLNDIQNSSGIKYDPTIVEALLKVINNINK